MTDEQTTGQTEETQGAPPGDAWREVGQQFKALGQSLASAFRAAWESEESRQHVQQLQAGLEAMANEVGQAAKDMAASAEGQKVKGEVEKAAESARLAGEKALQDAQPHLLAALNRVNAELQQMINRLEAEEPTAEAGAEDPGTE